MITILYILFIATCIVLVIAVLLQPGKADAGALFSSAISSTAFGPRGTQSLLAKITIGAAAGFMLIALALSMPFFKGEQSLLTTAEEEETQATPTPEASPAASPLASPGQGDANTGANPMPPESGTAPPAGGAAPPANSSSPTAPPGNN